MQDHQLLPVPPAGPATQAPQVPQQPVKPVQQPIVPDQPVPAQAIQHMPQLNCLHFKAEFAGKPEEDAEAHLLRTNDWVHTHAFSEGVKVQQFCLTLVGEARLWYESLRPLNVDC